MIWFHAQTQNDWKFKNFHNGETASRKVTNLVEPILKCPEHFPQIKKNTLIFVFSSVVFAPTTKTSKEGGRERGEWEKDCSRSLQFSIG